MDVEKISKIIGIAAVVIPIFSGGIAYTVGLANDNRNRGYENFHKIITQINDGGIGNYSGTQRSLIFELSKYPGYKDFTCRELPRMKAIFKNKETINEINSVYSLLECSQNT